ncbi:MAG: hypothetical protein IJS90_00245, partial [Clostridia bacterium]|nr:hypothetical protein [Clostridia bacterium]
RFCLTATAMADSKAEFLRRKALRSSRFLVLFCLPEAFPKFRGAFGFFIPRDGFFILRVIVFFMPCAIITTKQKTGGKRYARCSL